MLGDDDDFPLGMSGGIDFDDDSREYKPPNFGASTRDIVVKKNDKSGQKFDAIDDSSEFSNVSSVERNRRLRDDHHDYLERPLSPTRVPETRTQY